MILYFCDVGKRSILIQDIGECTFIKSKRSKKIRIKVEPHKPVTTYIPTYVSYDFAYNYLLSKKEWLKKAKDKIAEIERQRTIFTPETVYFTRFHQLKINPNQKTRLTAKIENGLINVFCPEEVQLDNREVQEFIKKAIIETYRIEAKQILPKKLHELAVKYGYNYNKVAIKNLKSRWGSCSSKNNINLNLHLVRLPGHLMEYVLVHELVHTMHKNHGIEFWNALNKHVKNAKKLQHELRNYSVEL